MSADCTRIAVMFSKVPGKQTVPRSELWALLSILRRMQDGEHYTVYIDASYVINGVKARTPHYSRGCNGDIWTKIFKETDRLESLHTVKVKSHVESKEDWEKYAMTRDAYLYNAGPDKSTSGAANSKYIRNQAERQSDGSQWWDTYRAAQRITTIEASIRRDCKPTKHPGKDFAKLEEGREKAVKRKLDEAIESTEKHKLYTCDAGWVRCYDCQGRARPAAEQDYWIGRECRVISK